MSNIEGGGKSHGFKMFRLFSSLTGIVIISKLFGFFKQMLIASTFGATIETDILSLAEGFIANVDYLFTQVLITGFSTVYLHVKAKEKRRSEILFSNTFYSVILLSGALCLVFELLAPVIAKIIAPSYGGENAAMLVVRIRSYAPQIILVSVIALFCAVLNTHERFIPVNLVPMNQSVIMIIAVFVLHGIYGLNTLVIGSYSYYIFNALLLLFLIRKYADFRSGISLKNPDLRQLVSIMMPLLLGYSMIFVNQQVDKIIVSGMEAGNVTSLHYAQVLSNMVTALIGTISTVIYTKITKAASAGDLGQANQTTQTASELLVSCLLPISLITMLFSKEIVQTVFGHGNFDQHAVAVSSKALIGYAVFFVPTALKNLYAKFLYGNLNTKTPMRNSIIGILINICLSIVLSRFWGILGVTLASSAAEIVACALNMYYCKKQIRETSFERLKKDTVRWVIGLLAAFAVTVLVKPHLSSLPAVVVFLISIPLVIVPYSIAAFPIFKNYLKKLSKR